MHQLQKDGKRPGQPGYDPRTLFIPPKAWKDFTPFEKQVSQLRTFIYDAEKLTADGQFWEIKQNHFDTVLFFQKGYVS
jgi:DNA mismatch repair protein MSH6